MNLSFPIIYTKMNYDRTKELHVLKQYELNPEYLKDTHILLMDKLIEVTQG